MIRLLASERMYGTKQVFLRELLQNSLDSVRYRAEKAGKDFHPRVEFSYNPRTRVLKCRDNGEGMTLDMVKNYLLRIGSSFYCSEEFLREATDFSWRAISEFGIGVLTCFMVSNEITLETFHLASHPFRVVLDNRFAYFEVAQTAAEKWKQPGDYCVLSN